MTSWAAHHSAIRELEAMTAALEDRIRLHWETMRRRRDLAAWCNDFSSSTHEYPADCTFVQDEAVQRTALVSLLRIRKAARAAGRRPS